MKQNDITLVKAKRFDISKIMDIIEVAQKHFKESGINQWQNNYPNNKVIEKDIENNNSYVLKQGKNIVGTSAVIFTGEETYDKIYEGEWLTSSKYAAIHRIAIDFSYRGTGLASVFISEIERLCIEKEIYSIRADTHRDNIAMTKLLIKNGYERCGIIYLKDKSERIGFEKVLRNK